MKKAFFLFTLFLSVSLLTVVGQKKKVAIMGYDPVSYFGGTPTEGSKSFQSTYQGSTYNFLSKESKGIFDGNPAKYSPQYGGWCAYAMGLDGSQVVINPQSYKMIDGKLYLFYKKGGVDTKSKWNKKEETLKNHADENWASQY